MGDEGSVSQSDGYALAKNGSDNQAFQADKSNGHQLQTFGKEDTNQSSPVASTIPSKGNEDGKDTCIDKCCKCSCMQKCSNKIIHAFESMFFKIGRLIGNHPWKTILVMVLFVALCGIGMLRFTQESDPDKLWSPQDSDAQKDQSWVNQNFPSYVQFSSMIFADSNVLTPSSLQAIADIYDQVVAISGSGYSWTILCARRGSACWVDSILAVWSHNTTVVRALSANDIIFDVNNYTASDITAYLGEVTRNSSNHIVSAGATSMSIGLWDNSTVTNFGTRDANVEAFEQQFIDIGKAGNPSLDNVYVYAVRTFGDEAGESISGDVVLLSIGYMVILVYVIIVLGRFNCVQHKAYVALVGVLCVGLSLLVSFGLSSAFGFFYGPVHSILPFLLLGIGVDDMFVIIQAYTNLGPAERKGSVPEKTAVMMKHAGVAITITSLTDFCAFAVGATTVLPALRSFCLYSAIGILGLLLLQGSIFVAAHSLDEHRAENTRNACCCCYRHRDYTPNKCSQREVLATVGEKAYVPLFLKVPFKLVAIFIIIATLGILGWGIYGMTQIKQDYDPVWFLPTDSYATEYFTANDKYFPSDGARAYVYTGAIDYYTNRQVLVDIYNNLRSDTYVKQSSVVSWYNAYASYLNSTSTTFPVSSSAFYTSVGTWVSGAGAFYSGDIKFKSTGEIQTSRIRFQHTTLDDASEEIKAMDSVENMVKGLGYSWDQILVHSRFYAQWETNRIIQAELYRNLALACACILIVTMVLLANIWLVLMVFSCVVFTLVDVIALMHFWGLTIDTVTSIQLILAIGLAVDYSAHIGHFFMTVRGTRNERAAETVVRMGSAVFHGGFSTFLAFVLLAGSNSYVFITFFKVFFGVVLFGLFHGLIYLPAMLSLVGPPPYDTATPITAHKEMDFAKVDKEPERTTSPNV